MIPYVTLGLFTLGIPPISRPPRVYLGNPQMDRTIYPPPPFERSGGGVGVGCGGGGGGGHGTVNIFSLANGRTELSRNAHCSVVARRKSRNGEDLGEGSAIGPFRHLPRRGHAHASTPNVWGYLRGVRYSFFFHLVFFVFFAIYPAVSAEKANPRRPFRHRLRQERMQLAGADSAPLRLFTS